MHRNVQYFLIICCLIGFAIEPASALQSVPDVVWSKNIVQDVADIRFNMVQDNQNGCIVPAVDLSGLNIITVTKDGDVNCVKSTSNEYTTFPNLALETSSDGCNILSSWLGSPSLIKIDSKGNLQWSKNYPEYANGGVSGFAFVRSTTDGGYVITGEGGSTVFLIKSNSEGNEQWSKNIENGLWPLDIRQTKDGGYIICGITRTNYSNNRENVGILKTDDKGNEIWMKSYGGSTSDGAYSIRQTKDGGYIVAGWKNSDSTWSGKSSNAWAIKVDYNGAEQWSTILGEEEGCIDLRSVIQDGDGGYIFGGSVPTDLNAEGALLFKLDENGKNVWKKRFDGKITSIEDMIIDDNGRYVIAGHHDPDAAYFTSYSDIWVIKLQDPNLSPSQDGKTSSEEPGVKTVPGFGIMACLISLGFIVLFRRN
jgi:hypothetical protein